jgi:hypothetical protein
MGLFQLPGTGWIAGANQLALIDRLWRTWSPSFSLPDEDRAELHACLTASMPAPIGYRARVHEVICECRSLLLQEAPHALAARVTRWLA